MTGLPARRARRALAVSAMAIVGPLVAAGCVADRAPISTTGTTTFASQLFCEPVHALSIDAWTDQGPRGRVARDLTAARDHAPASVHAVLDTLIELERAGVHPGAADETSGATVGTGPMPLARWSDAMATLSDVADRECDVDLIAGAASDAVPGAPAIEGKPAGSAELAPADVIDLVRAKRPEARWIDRALSLIHI